MSTVIEIQEAIQKLPSKDKSALTAWLESQEEPALSSQEEAALLARLDKAAQELDAGKGVPLQNVRAMVGKWATK
jgi:FMN-dependent NADH-azoreductase